MTGPADDPEIRTIVEITEQITTSYILGGVNALTFVQKRKYHRPVSVLWQTAEQSLGVTWASVGATEGSSLRQSFEGFRNMDRPK